MSITSKAMAALAFWGALTVSTAPCLANTIPGGGTDGLCTPHIGGASAGVTTCTVNEGQGDTLLELVVNFTGVNVRVNSVTSGVIVPVAGDNTDDITTDPIGPGFAGLLNAGPFGAFNVVDCLTKPLLAPGAACTFNQSFTTDAPDVGPLADGESTMSFILGLTPANANLVVACGIGTGQALGPTALGTLYCLGANPTPNDGRGALLVQITSADVIVNDVAAPEPDALGLWCLGGVLLVGGSKAIRRRR